MTAGSYVGVYCLSFLGPGISLHSQNFQYHKNFTPQCIPSIWSLKHGPCVTYNIFLFSFISKLEIQDGFDYE